MKLNNGITTSIYLTLMFIGYVNVCFASFTEKENPFLGKEFWSTQPSIANIEENIQKGFSVTESNEHGFDATCYAILEKNSIKTVEFLLSQGNDVNKITHDFRTYIFWAAYKGNLPLMENLLSKGARMDLTDSHGYSILNFAAATGQRDLGIYEFCIANGADIKNEKNHDGKNALLSIAPKLEDLSMIDYFVSKGLHITDVDKHGNGIFNHAAKGGNIKVLKALVAKGVPTNVNSKTGENAIFFATKGGRGITVNKEVFTYLESLGLKPNVKTDKGVTPLHNLARSSNKQEDFEYFISKGVNVNETDSEGNTALIKASERNTLEIVSYLVSKSNDINFENTKGHTALTKAVKGNTIDVVDFLLSKGAKADIMDKENNTLAKVLIESYSPKKSDLFDAKKEALLKAGLNLGKTQSNGSNIFHLAMAKNNLKLLKNIEALKVADINAKDNQGNTVLHYAAMKSNNTEILDFLISKGANKSMKTSFGESPYDLAQENELLKGISISFLK